MAWDEITHSLSWAVSASAFLSFFLLNLAEEKTDTYLHLLTYYRLNSFDIVAQSCLSCVCVIGIVWVDCSAAPLVQGGGGLNLGPKNTKHNNNILDSIYYVKPSSQNLGKRIIMKIPTNWK